MSGLVKGGITITDISCMRKTEVRKAQCLVSGNTAYK